EEGAHDSHHVGGGKDEEEDEEGQRRAVAPVVTVAAVARGAVVPGVGAGVVPAVVKVVEVLAAVPIAQVVAPVAPGAGGDDAETRGVEVGRVQIECHGGSLSANRDDSAYLAHDLPPLLTRPTPLAAGFLRAGSSRARTRSPSYRR